MSIKILPVIKTLVTGITVSVVDAVKKTPIVSNTIAMEAPTVTTIDTILAVGSSKTLTDISFLCVNTWSSYDLEVTVGGNTTRFTATSSFVLRATLDTVTIFNTNTEPLRLELVIA